MLSPEIRDLSCPSIPAPDLLAGLRIHFPQTALFEQAGKTAYVACQAQRWLGWDEQFIWSFNRGSGNWDRQRYHSLEERDSYWQDYWQQVPNAHWMGYADASEGYWAAYRYIFKQDAKGNYQLLEQGDDDSGYSTEALQNYLYQIPRKLRPFEHSGEVESHPRSIVEPQKRMMRPVLRNLQQQQLYRGSAFSYFQQKIGRAQYSFFIEASDRQWTGFSPKLALMGKEGKWEQPLYFSKNRSPEGEADWTAAERWAVDLALSDLADIGIRAEHPEFALSLRKQGQFPLSFEPGDKAIALLQSLASPKHLGVAGWFQADATCLVPLLQLNRFLGRRHRWWQEQK